MSCATRSMPAMSRPTIFGQPASAACATSGWTCVGAVDRDVAVALHRSPCGQAAGTDCVSEALGAAVRGAGYRDRWPRSMRFERKLFFGAAPRIAVELALDQLGDGRGAVGRRAVTISPRAAATTLPPTTSSRCSWPRYETLDQHLAAVRLGDTGRRRSISSDCVDRFERDAAAVVRVRRLDHATGRPMSCADVPGGLGAVWPRCGLRVPARRTMRAGSWSNPCPAQCLRRSRWC